MSRLSYLLQTIRSLPASPLRPTPSAQLSSALESIISRNFPSQSDPSASAPAHQLGPSEERAVEGMIGSLERIQSNSAYNQYRLSTRTLRPQHDPLYYTRLLEGVQRAKRGEGRSFWKRFFQLRGEA